jgi:hypothetical protein
MKRTWSAVQTFSLPKETVYTADKWGNAIKEFTKPCGLERKERNPPQGSGEISPAGLLSPSKC